MPGWWHGARRADKRLILRRAKKRMIPKSGYRFSEKIMRKQ